MTKSTILAAALLSTLGVAGLADTAQARDYPVCIQGRYAFSGGGDTIECSFDTYAQCRATASGLGAGCIDNPLYQARGQIVVPDSPRHRRVRRYPD